MPTDLSPTARALRTMEILRSRPGTTAAELAAALGVTERAVRRYVGILKEAGVPVESARGPYGGYRLGRGARLPPVVFTEAEALALVMAALTDTDALVGTALDKVVRVLPEDVGRQAATLRDHAAAAPDPHAARPDPATTGALVTACAVRRSVRVTYRGESGRESAGLVDPWAVVVRHGRWYLLCRSHRADAIRTYRVDRIGEVRQTTRAFTPPEGLDPVAVLEENLGTGWEYPVRVVFDAPPGDVARWVRPPMGRLQAAGGGCVLAGSTSAPEMYARDWLARMPFGFRVEGGPELRAAVAALGAQLTAAAEPEAGTGA
ncbi:helix-turn-helix transcriptional regulator [Streptomyces sp. MAR4 CNX-425]|uniref:helix-turn-helix transcriptional regulator n=1 Tax=Streptomyces sp. MAR4 CNX-425 TaxID=3406343 RepID=UPI003B505592